MSKINRRPPKYRLQKARGLAVVTLNGKDHYLGPWKSEASYHEYDRLIAEWLAAGRTTEATRRQPELSVDDVIAQFWAFAKMHYRKHGEPTKELDNLRYAARTLRRLYGHVPANDFGPKALKSIQAQMILTGNSRSFINSQVGRIKRIFRWSVSEELVRPDLAHSLSCVRGLQQGRTEARETDPVQPVPDDVVQATVAHLPPVVGDLVMFQRLTGCRPTEACLIRPADIDRTAEVWRYRPASHKTEHHGRARVVLIGPRAQAVLTPYIDRPPESYCFSPAESGAQTRAARHARRTTPLSCGNRPGTNRRENPQRRPGDHYTRVTYLKAVYRACDKAFPPPQRLLQREFGSSFNLATREAEEQVHELNQWRRGHRWSPNQLRHAAATEIRQKFGLENAQAVLGHAKADVTEMYAAADLQKGETVMKAIG